MSNMSYCRFRNTLEDLQDCYDNFEEEISLDEEKARLKLLKLCQRISSDYDFETFELELKLSQAKEREEYK